MVSQFLENSGWTYAAVQLELPGVRSARHALSLAPVNMKCSVLEDLALQIVGTYLQEDLCIKVKVIPKALLQVVPCKT